MALAAAVLAGAASVVFLLVHLAGDPVSGLVPPGAAPDDVQRVREAYGLDRPLPAQYLDYLSRAARFEFGPSWRQQRPAIDAVLERLPATLALVGSAAALSLVSGAALGTLAATRPGGLADWLSRALALVGQAMPAFLLGTLLILLFAVRLRWLPASGWSGPASLVLPVATLAAFPAATTARLARASVSDALRGDYVRTARGKGLGELSLVLRHAAPNAALPVLAFTGFQVAFLVSGAAVVERLFAYPGMGQLALDAVADRDLPVIQAFAAVVAVIIVAVDAVTDGIAKLADPRLRDAGASGWRA